MRIYSYTTRFLVFVSLTVLLACNKTVSNVNSNLPPLNPANEDLNQKIKIESVILNGPLL